MYNRLLVIFTITVFFTGCLSHGKNDSSNAALNVKQAPRSAPFSKGVNFSGWFETNSAQSVPFTQYSEQDFINVKSLGADVIRLPVRFHDMTNGAPDYILDPLLFKLLDSVVDWAEKQKLYIIIDNHSFHPVNPTPYDIDKVLLPVWAQIAQRYSSRSDYVVYEILNEPHGLSDRRWGEIQGKAIETIRIYDQKHAIIVGGMDYNSVNKLSAIPEYSDQNLIYTFHYYDPYVFTHQGEWWGGEVNLATLEGVPFPYERKRMPAVPEKLRGTWAESWLRDYWSASSVKAMLKPFETAVAFSKKRNVPVFCGEFGVLINNSHAEDRIKWYEFVTDALDKRNISRTSWDYFGAFGIFNISGKGDFNSELNVEVVRAMKFNAPLQVPKTPDSLRAGIVFFDDYPSRRLNAYYWGDGDFSFYETNAADGEFAIRWGNASRYSAFGFIFNGGTDLTEIAASGYFLEFKARAEKPVNFDVRFIDVEKGDIIPWRMNYSVDENELAPDGRWRTIRIPLSGMSEHGAWIISTETWLNPRGEFKWDQIDRLEFSMENMDLKDINVYFDSIRLTR